ncbi:MAG TPA: protein-methionine-sulfoxide reductase heme-binding subunit MsrQ [Candidatus Acidoferrales bacterium]|nr:protein-methionine-sulfoxide reductase heme-binding subunit MsrQ [Candidatus Acidoferrales bacterium]
MKIKRNTVLKPIVFLACLLPLLSLVYAGFTAHLGADPVMRVTHVTGGWTLKLLLVSLAITPLRRITGVTWLIQYRRMIGLFSFFYACLHLLTYLVLDQSLNPGRIVHDIGKRPFVTVGFAAWALLVPLAITSTQSAIRRLGKKWQSLHRIVYLAAAFGVLHFYWLVKKDVSEPLSYAAVLAILLGYRAVLYAVERTRRAPQPAKQPASA